MKEEGGGVTTAVAGELRGGGDKGSGGNRWKGNDCDDRGRRDTMSTKSDGRGRGTKGVRGRDGK